MKRKLGFFVFFLIFITYMSSYAFGFSINELDGSGASVSEIEKVGNGILEIISLIASGISIIAIIILGIKYMMGSVEEKAEYKKTLVPYIIGAICVFGATLIPHIVYDFFN